MSSAQLRKLMILILYVFLSLGWTPAYPTELYLLDLTISRTVKIEEHQAAV